MPNESKYCVYCASDLAGEGKCPECGQTHTDQIARHAVDKRMAAMLIHWVKRLAIAQEQIALMLGLYGRWKGFLASKNDLDKPTPPDDTDTTTNQGKGEME
jgi:hypothetical protein